MYRIDCEDVSSRIQFVLNRLVSNRLSVCTESTKLPLELCGRLKVDQVLPERSDVTLSRDITCSATHWTLLSHIILN